MSRFSRLLPRFLRSDKEKSNYSKDVQYFGGGDRPMKDGSICKILFLDDTEIVLSCKGNCKGSSLLDKVYEHLNVVEKDYFGLRYLDQSDQTHWLDSQKTLSSQLKSCNIPYNLYFGVKFYPADPCKLREEITRYQFYLQVKRDILQGRLPLTFDEAAELFAYGVQSELGDFDPKRLSDGYVSEFRFVPNQTEVLEDKISAYHRRLIGLHAADAEYKFLDKVKWLDMYGVDLHPVLGEANTEYFLGLTPTGIVVYKNKTKVGNYFWPRINKVTFKGKIFIIKVRDRINDEHTYAFEVATKVGCKHLWKCCIEHHAFFRLNHEGDFARSEKSYRSVSSRRSSGRQDRLNHSDYGRQQPDVLRVPSKRHPRRTSSDSGLHSRMDGLKYMINDRPVTMVAAPEPVKGPRHTSLPDLNGKGSPLSARSAPWNTNADTGMYTSGRDSPTSMYSDTSKFPGRRGGGGGGAGSDTESGYRRKYFPNRTKGSDNESDVSFSRRRRREADSGSESDVSPVRQRNRRPKRSADDWFESQWRDAMSGMHIQNKESQMNGSIPSIHSAPAGEIAKRRRRRRTKSPASNKQPPLELKEHIQYDLVDPVGMTEDELREIPYTKVETKAEPFKIKYSPKTRQRYRSPKRKSFGDLDQNNRLPGMLIDEPPPPYTPQGSATATPELNHRNYYSDTNSYYRSDRNIDGPYYRKDISELSNGIIKTNEESANSNNKQSFHSSGLGYRMDNTRTSSRSQTQKEDLNSKSNLSSHSSRSTLQDNDQQNLMDDQSDGHSLTNSVTNSVCGDPGGDRSHGDDRLSNEHVCNTNRQQIQVNKNLNDKNLHISEGKGKEHSLYGNSNHIPGTGHSLGVDENFTDFQRAPGKNLTMNNVSDTNQTLNSGSYTQNRIPVSGSQDQNRTPVSSAQGQNRTPVNSAQGQNRTPVNSAQGQNRTPVSSAQGQNRTPVNSAQGQNRTPVNSAQGQNRTPVNNAQGQNRTPVNSAQNRKQVDNSQVQIRTQSVEGQNRIPVNSAYSQNMTPVSSVQIQGRTPVKNSYSPDRTPVKSSYDPDRTPVKSSHNVETTPVKYDADSSTVRSVHNHNRTPVSNAYTYERTPDNANVSNRTSHVDTGRTSNPHVSANIQNTPDRQSAFIPNHRQNRQVPQSYSRHGPPSMFDHSPYHGSNVQSVSVSTSRTFTTQENIRKLYSSPQEKKPVYATQDNIRRLYNMGPDQTTPTKQEPVARKTFHSTLSQNSVQPHTHQQTPSPRKPYQHPHLQASQGPGEISVNRGLTRNIIDANVIHPTLSSPHYRRDLWTEI